jgi:hypothetical protein
MTMMPTTKKTSNKIDYNNAEFYDSGDGVEYEIWICKKTNKRFVVPIEIQRYFEDAEELENQDW